ncbi:hypothetical protein OQA88_12457 [Cercophora sp. LCS_1]
MLEFNPRLDYGSRLNAIIWLMISVAAIFLFTRLYLKNCQNRGLWWDDYALLAAWVFQATQAGLVSYIITLGYGKSVIPLENGRLFGLPVNMLSTFLILANFLGKLSFALTLLRMPAVWLRITVWYIIITLAATLGLSGALVWIECFDFKRKTNCVPVDISVSYNIFSCVYSAIMDVALAFLPWKFIWELQMSKKEKFGVVVAMSMGVFAGAAAGLKITALPTVAKDPQASIGLVIWGNAESAICIMAASIPILRALVRGGLRGPVPRGYRTDETGYETAMTESRTAMSAAGAPRIIPRRPVGAPPAQRKEGSSGSVAAVSLDRTLTSDSPEPTKGKGAGDRGEWSDDDSIELANYDHARPQMPRDFLRPNPV